MLPENNYEKGFKAIAISTDKPVYNPLDIMFVRAFLFNSTTKAPLLKCEPATVIIKDPAGAEVVRANRAPCADAWVSFSYKVPESAPGGMYSLRVSIGDGPVEELTVRVRERKQRELELAVDFSRDSYYPGDSVRGKVTARPFTGSGPVRGTFSYSADLGG